ncbi:MAG TPA: amphi-Trp domain-containing protein, partial [Humidesulfovibrio sp.]|uniref:amphi-Trp domain-containing protein n=1 Tax=Humidesulfovibrio sp. TaxID=2910988 RepID=UPI002C66CBF4
MDKDKIELKTVMESAAVADYLTALAKGFKTGRLTIEKDGECLCLAPAETAEVEVEARVKKDKARFSLEVSWRLMGIEDDPASLKISADAPKDSPKDSAKDAKPMAKPAEKPAEKPAA